MVTEIDTHVMEFQQRTNRGQAYLEPVPAIHSKLINTKTQKLISNPLAFYRAGKCLLSDQKGVFYRARRSILQGS